MLGPRGSLLSSFSEVAQGLFAHEHGVDDPLFWSATFNFGLERSSLLRSWRSAPRGTLWLYPERGLFSPW